MKLAVERNLNKYAFPVFGIKGRPIDNYPCHAQYNLLEFFCDKGEFGAKNWMMMDVLATYLIHRYYNFKDGILEFKHTIPTSKDRRVMDVSGYKMGHGPINYVIKHINQCRDEQNYLREDVAEDSLLRYIEPASQGMKMIQTLKVKDSFLRQQVAPLRPYTSTEIHEMLKGTSECMMRMMYSIRYFDSESKKYANYAFNNYNLSSRLFSLTDSKITRTTGSGRILEREYTISFDTLLGYFYAQNCLSGYTDLVPDKFYDLSDYGQLFYRMLVLPYYKKAKIPLGINEIRHRLVLKTRDTYMVRKIIRRILDELEANSFIREPKEIKANGEYAYAYIRNSWAEINAGGDMTCESHLDSSTSDLEITDSDMDIPDSDMEIVHSDMDIEDTHLKKTTINEGT
ncbi:MAG: hypothetical protein ACLP9S_04760 [Syntrophales bacterium]